jgi:hypothetical protein
MDQIMELLILVKAQLIFILRFPSEYHQVDY